MFSQMKWAYIWFELVRAYLEGIAILIIRLSKVGLCAPLRFALMRNTIRALTDGLSLIREIRVPLNASSFSTNMALIRKTVSFDSCGGLPGR